MLAVVSCKSKSVRPQLGHETNSVFVFRIRHPCSRLNPVFRTKSTLKFAVSPTCSMRMPSPFPSVRRDPTLVPSPSAISFESSDVVLKWWMAGVLMSLDLKISKILRDAWSWDRPSAMLMKTIRGLRSLTFAIVSSSSEPSISIASRMAQSGIFPSAFTASSRLMSATVLSSGFLSSSSAGTMTPVPTSIILRSAVLSSFLSASGNVLMKMESLVATSLKGMPTAVLNPSSLYRYGAESADSIHGLTAEMTLPFGLRKSPTSTLSSAAVTGRSPTRLAYEVTSRVSTYVRTASCRSFAPGFLAARRASAISLRRLHGLYSNSGSSVSETRTVSPSPSARSVPMPTADFIRPSSPSPASVTPRWRG
mmetsp:Transcript_31490/g.75224  ORF Transcript_31490/g.75224 Transcript_31490/m.75224 type:complete len:365 (-) Transcript_31490:980-2074(-)